jgi:hypothetical protein
MRLIAEDWVLPCQVSRLENPEKAALVQEKEPGYGDEEKALKWGGGV